MAADLGLPETCIKLALVGPEQKQDLASIAKISDLKTAQRLFKQAKSYERKKLILKRAVEISKTCDDLNFVHDDIDLDGLLNNDVELRATHMIMYRGYIQSEIAKVTTLGQAFDLWVKIDHEVFFEEDWSLFERMKSFVGETDTVEALMILESDLGREAYDVRCHQYSLIVQVCKCATPEQALAALRYHKEYAWDGQEDSYPISLLLKKVASLYPV